MEQIIVMAERVISNFGMIAITDIIDIAIMAFLIYKLIILISSTNSGKVARGIIFLIAALAMSSLCNLYTVSWLLNRALEVGVLALILALAVGAFAAAGAAEAVGAGGQQPARQGVFGKPGGSL